MKAQVIETVNTLLPPTTTWAEIAAVELPAEESKAVKGLRSWLQECDEILARPERTSGAEIQELAKAFSPTWTKCRKYEIALSVVSRDRRTLAWELKMPEAVRQALLIGLMELFADAADRWASLVALGAKLGLAVKVDLS